MKDKRTRVWNVISKAYSEIGHPDWEPDELNETEEGWITPSNEFLKSAIGSGTKLEYKVNPENKTEIQVRPYSLRGLVSEGEYNKKFLRQAPTKGLYRLGISTHKRVWIPEEGYEYVTKYINYKNPLTYLFLLASILVLVGAFIADCLVGVYNKAKEYLSEAKDLVKEFSNYTESYYEE